MEKFSHAIKCRQCKCLLESPVLLPCCHSVCKKHEQERTTIVCIECDTEYEIPSGGFSENKDLALIIDSGIIKKIIEIDLGPKHKSAVEYCDTVKKIIEEIEQIVKDPFNYVYEHISELKSRIHLNREEFKLKIDEEAETLLEQLKQCEIDCEKKSKSNEIESISKETGRELEAKKHDLDNWMRYLNNFYFDTDEFSNIETKCKDSISQLQTQLDSFKTSLLIDNFKKVEIMVNKFETIGLFFNYSSPIKGNCYATLKTENEDEYRLIVLRDGSFACGRTNGSISIWNSDTQTIIRELIGHTDIIRSIKELTEGRLVSASDDRTIKIWNAQSGQLLRSLEGHTDTVWTLECLTNGLLASGSADETIKIWNVNSGELLKTIDVEEDIYSLCLLRDGNLACSSESKLTIFNPLTKRIVKTIVGDTFIKLCLLSNGNLAIGQKDSDITIWDVNSWKLLRTLIGHADEISELKLMNDGSLASGSDDGELKIWNPINGYLLKTIKVDDVYKVDSFCMFSNGRFVTLSSGGIKFWE